MSRGSSYTPGRRGLSPACSSASLSDARPCSCWTLRSCVRWRKRVAHTARCVAWIAPAWTRRLAVPIDTGWSRRAVRRGSPTSTRPLLSTARAPRGTYAATQRREGRWRGASIATPSSSAADSSMGWPRAARSAVLEACAPPDRCSMSWPARGPPKPRGSEYL